MTCHFDPYGSQMDVYDHTGTMVAEGVEQNGWGERGFPDEVLDHLYAARDGGGQPTAYNQELLFCLGAEQIEEGTPP